MKTFTQKMLEKEKLKELLHGSGTVNPEQAKALAEWQIFIHKKQKSNDY